MVQQRPTLSNRAAVGQQLVYQHTHSSSPETRARLINHYKYLVAASAARLCLSGEQDDLRGAGNIGLIRAVDRYMPDRGKFESYAIHLIRGAMLDSLRDAAWVPRSVSELAKQIEATRSNLIEELGRLPADTEVCSALCYTEEDWAAVRKLLDRQMPISLSTLLCSSDEPGCPTELCDILQSDTDDVSERAIQEIERATVQAALAQLPDRERSVVLLYMAGETFVSMGNLLGISDARTFQLYWAGIRQMRERLSEQFATLPQTSAICGG